MDFPRFIKIILGTLPFVSLCFVIAKINLNKANRSRQFLMPLVTLIYCILGVYRLDKINELVYKLFIWLGQQFPYIQQLPWESIAAIALNTFLVLGLIVVKSIVLPIINEIWKSKKLSEYTSAFFYEREDDVDKWLLNPSFTNFRGYVKGFYIANIVVAILIFILSRYFPKAIFFQATLYPVFGVLLIGEIFFFLSGLTKSEFVEDVLGEDEESYKVANYGMLREILRELFGDRVLYEITVDASDGTSTSFEELDEMAQSEDPSLKMIGSYYLNLKENDIEIDVNYVRSSVNLLNGKSTLFCNPFYRDLTHYLILPMMRQLISYKKCLIVLGRDSALSDVKSWIDSGLENFSNTDSLWQSQVLDEYGNTSDVGIIKFSDIHNLKIHKANKDFLSKVGFVLIIEPSRILASGQIGLSLLVNNCEGTGKEIVYCACDRNCDGLVDALSHTLKTSITEVTATVNGGGNNSQMYWNADGDYMHHKIFPNISRYLGMGTEINAVAMKYQLDQTGWVGSEKFPVLDMKWIAGQYHKQICQYADLPESQASFDSSFNVYSNLWNTERKENSFLVVEDEFQNLFEISRVFASRAKSQGFVNVISENYFLRDYMLDNVDIFSADPKAIPTIVPDFARTERNMVLKLLMMMAYDLVSEEKIAKELMLCGISFEDPYDTFKDLVIKHCHVEDASLSVRFRDELQSDSLNSVVVKYYEINETNELFEYAQLLKNAYYIAEDEEGESHYIGAKLYGHVFQAMLPGQFMTFEGKYYEVQTVTPLNGVVVRRAADHITGRRYYRQIRRFVINNWADGTEMGSKRTFSDIEITRGYADISVETDGYLDMNSYGDLANAKKVSLNGVPTRNYRNKSVLRIRLPESTTNRILYTICLLMNEIFRTTYPETYHYVAVLTPHNDEIHSENLEYATYRLDGDCDANCLYIVEDSDIDLGLIVSIERNFKRYLEIIADVLNWHSLKMLEKPPGEEESKEEFVPEFSEKPNLKGFAAALENVKSFFEGLFGKKKKEEPQTEGNGTAGEASPAEGTTVAMPQADSTGEVSYGGEENTSATSSTEEKMTIAKRFVQKIKNFFKKLFGKNIDEAVPVDEEVTEPEEVYGLVDETDEVSESFEEILGEEFNDGEKFIDEVSVEESDTEEIVADETIAGESNAEETVADETIAEESDTEEIVADETFAEELNAEENDMEEPEDSDHTMLLRSVSEILPEITESEDPEGAQEVEGEDEELTSKVPTELTPYQENAFVKFGYESIDEVLDIEGTSELLEKLGFDNNPLQQVRETTGNINEETDDYDPHKYGAHLCDFCGVELLGGEYELLQDGRERCNRCSMTAVKKVEDFKALYKTVLRNMEAFYGIKLNVAVKVRMTDAKQIARHVDEQFVATPGFDGRTLGFARKDKTGYCIYIENGSPKLAAMATIAHELTHIWQYLNWNEAELAGIYGKKNLLEVYEGMAKWAEIQYLMLMNEKAYAKRQAITTRLRNDEYGFGFKIYEEKYPLSNEANVTRTPFKENPPL